MSGHHPWREIEHKRAATPERWRLTVTRAYRPWWTLWLLVRWHEIGLLRDGTEEEVLASAAALKAQYPDWQFDLRRA